jgi:hypothetical protein
MPQQALLLPRTRTGIALTLVALMLVFYSGGGCGGFLGVASAFAKDGSSGGGSDDSGGGGSPDDHSGRGRDGDPLRDATRHGNGPDDNLSTGLHLEVIYSDGYHEVIDGGILVLTDPRGNTVIRRTARMVDVRRLRALPH